MSAARSPAESGGEYTSLYSHDGIGCCCYPNTLRTGDPRDGSHNVIRSVRCRPAGCCPPSPGLYKHASFATAEVFIASQVRLSVLVWPGAPPWVETFRKSRSPQQHRLLAILPAVLTDMAPLQYRCRSRKRLWQQTHGPESVLWALAALLTQTRMAQPAAAAVHMDMMRNRTKPS